MSQKNIFVVLLCIPISISCFHWKIATNMTLPIPLARSPFGSTLQNDYLYIFGGERSGENDNIYMNTTNIVYKWWTDSGNNANWVVTNITMPKNVSLVCNAPCSVTVENCIYIVIPSTTSAGKLQSNIIYKFNTETLKWTTNLNNNLKYELDSSACVATNHTHIFVFGGLSKGIPVNYNQIYDIQQDEWSLASPLRVDNWYGGSCVYYDKIVYIFGGQTVDTVHANKIKFWVDVWKYFPSNDSWHQSDAALVIPRSGSYAAVSHNNKIYVAGGYNITDSATLYYNAVDVYDINSDKCIAERMIHKKAYPMMLINDSYIYVLGGEINAKKGTSLAYKIIEMADISSSSSDTFWVIIFIASAILLVLVVVSCIIFIKKRKHIGDKKQKLVAIGNIQDDAKENQNDHPIEEHKEGQDNTAYH